MRKAHHKKILRRVIALLSVFVLLVTVNNLTFVAVTLEGTPSCGYAEHVHDETCFDEANRLVCPLAEHTHTDACYGQQAVAGVVRAEGIDPAASELPEVELSEADGMLYDPAEAPPRRPARRRSRRARTRATSSGRSIPSI